MKRTYYFLLLLAAIVQACGKDNAPTGGEGNGEYTIDWNAAADSSSMSLTDNFWNASVHYFNSSSDGNSNFQYWPQAHALNVLVDAYKRTGDNTYMSVINQWYDGVKTGNGGSFLNHFYDDMEWNALAMLRVYDATGDTRFKTAAETVWSDIQTGWNTNGGGGIAWNKSELYSKNACSNGPAAVLAALLYEKFGDESNKEWAIKIYNWEKETLFNPASGAVYDNLDAKTGEIKTSWVFTYNQGTFLGAALELYKITGDKSYLNDAVKAADYTLNTLVNSNDQLLKDEGSGDGGLFKGIFIRYFSELIKLPDLDSGTKKRYLTFLKHNAEILWREGTNKQQVFYSTYWKTKPVSATGLTEQLSGSMLIEAAALLLVNP